MDRKKNTKSHRHVSKCTTDNKLKKKHLMQRKNNKHDDFKNINQTNKHSIDDTKYVNINEGETDVNEIIEKYIDVTPVHFQEKEQEILREIINEYMSGQVKNDVNKVISISTRAKRNTLQIEAEKDEEEYEDTKFDPPDVPTAKERHYDFIVGRGRYEPRDYLNLPLNQQFANRNVIYIDPNPAVNADVKETIGKVDFHLFEICGDQDPENRITVRMFFDWSTVYCGALQTLPLVAKNIGRKFTIYIPLGYDEHKIAGEVARELNDPMFSISLVEGQYPLFNWNENANLESMKKIFPEAISIANIINPNKYMLILVNDDSTQLLHRHKKI
jgi:hypothetical protein